MIYSPFITGSGRERFETLRVLVGLRVVKNYFLGFDSGCVLTLNGISVTLNGISGLGFTRPIQILLGFIPLSAIFAESAITVICIFKHDYCVA